MQMGVNKQELGIALERRTVQVCRATAQRWQQEQPDVTTGQCPSSDITHVAQKVPRFPLPKHRVQRFNDVISWYRETRVSPSLLPSPGTSTQNCQLALHRRGGTQPPLRPRRFGTLQTSSLCSCCFVGFFSSVGSSHSSC